MLLKTNWVRKMIKILITGMLLAGIVVLVACKKEKINDSMLSSGDNGTGKEKILPKGVGTVKNAEDIYISYENNVLVVEGNGEKVSLDADGLHMISDDEAVDITENGFKAEDGDSSVEVGVNGIRIMDGDSDTSLSISMPNLQISDGEEDSNWLDFDRIDNLKLLDNTIDVNGNKKHIKVYIQDGYLVTVNCNEETTKVVGLSMEKSESDNAGNRYRYYVK